MYSDYELLSVKVPGYNILIINSVPASGQFDYNDSFDQTIQQLASRYRVITTKKVVGVDCTLDTGMSLVDIGALAANCDHLVAIETGPHSACLNKWTVQNIKSWIVGHNTNSFLYNNSLAVKNMNELINVLHRVYL
jgi:hypothetical protein